MMRIAARHGASNLRVFGSRARGDSNELSDLDLLVDLGPRRSLIDQIGLKQDLEELLGCGVDVVTERALSPYLRDRILAEARPI